MSELKPYYLVHITTDEEYKTPLVASQLFDQAECQAKIKAGYAPSHVEVWIIGAMRSYFEKAAQAKLKSLRARCPHIGIRMMNGVGRLNEYPVFLLLKAARYRLNKNIPVIYHCRGENAAKYAAVLKESFPKDKIVVDVRGYWPAELLYVKGIIDPETATGKDKEAFNKAYSFLKKTICIADGVTTVSPLLRELLIREMQASDDTIVVPCCVNHVTTDEKRDEIRKEWNIKDDEIALVYSGTTAPYQHLEDLTIPFMKKLLDTHKKLKLVFLSPEIKKINLMLADAGINMDRVIVRSLLQHEVAASLTACDAGILIRKPTLVNQVANPVKIAEYLAAGLPVIIEKGIGGMPQRLFDMALLKEIEISNEKKAEEAPELVNKWLGEDMKARRTQARAIVKELYLWESAIYTSRGMYGKLLNER